MRNIELDSKLPEDDNISNLQTDENGHPFRMVNCQKIGQIEENTQHDVDMNKIINRARACGMSGWEYLNR